MAWKVQRWGGNAPPKMGTNTHAPDGLPKVILPPALYDAGESLGIDMRWYMKQQLIPTKVKD